MAPLLKPTRIAEIAVVKITQIDLASLGTEQVSILGVELHSELAIPGRGDGHVVVRRLVPVNRQDHVGAGRVVITNAWRQYAGQALAIDRKLEIRQIQERWYATQTPVFLGGKGRTD